MFKDIKPATLFALSGFLVAITLGGGSLLAIIFNDNWHIQQNSFSDLGAADSSTKVLFNVACILAGIFMIIFSIGYMKYGRKLAKIGGLVLFVDAIVLILVGAISKEVSFDHHLLVSMLFASLFLAGAAFVCVQDVLDGHWKYVLPVALAGLVVGVVWGLYLALGEENVSYGLAQIVSFGAAFVWLLSVTVKNFKIGIGTENDIKA